jgi:hypothetical protein
VDDHPPVLQLPPAAADDEGNIASGVANVEDAIDAARLVLLDVVGRNAGRDAGEGGSQAVDSLRGEVFGDALDVHADAGLGLVADGGEELLRGFVHILSQSPERSLHGATSTSGCSRPMLEQRAELYKGIPEFLGKIASAVVVLRTAG